MRTVPVGDFAVGAGHPPRIMGVLNMSVESNWEPNVYGNAEEAAAFAREELVADGADIVDIGLQSANPKNDWLPAETELDRLPAALEVADRIGDDAVLSIETRYAEVAEEALAGSFDLVNDVCGFADPKMPAVCESYDAPVVKMASPKDIRKPGHVKTIDDAFDALLEGGFTDKTIVDPAFGGWYDGRTYEDNWEMFRRLREFRALGRPILTGTNREDFLGAIAGRMENEEQLNVSLAAATLEVDRGADIIRTHDVPETHDVVQVAHHLRTERVVSESPRVIAFGPVSAGELSRYELVGEGTVGDTGGASGTSFKIETAGESAGAALKQAAKSAGAVCVDCGDHALVVGTHDALGRLVERLGGGRGQLADVADRLDEALARG